MARELTIDGTRIADDTDAFCIAELGNNHAGIAEMLGLSHLEACKRLIQAAHDAGANAVKLQKRSNRTLYARALYESPYTSENAFGPTYGAHREALEFDFAEYVELRDYADELGITFFATPFDFESVDFLERLGVPCYKVASGDLTNTLLIRYVASMRKPVILSTGGGTIDDVERALMAVYSADSEPHTAVLQCTAVYPCPPELLNLSSVQTMNYRLWPSTIGLSSHYTGIMDCLAAYVLGARIFEKHFTLNRAARGTDHAFSLEPKGLATLVEDLRKLRLALGDGVKRRYPQEAAAMQKMAKSLVAARHIPVDHVLDAADIAVKSPGGGIPAWKLEQVIGRTMPVELEPDEPIWSSSGSV